MLLTHYFALLLVRSQCIYLQLVTLLFPQVPAVDFVCLEPTDKSSVFKPDKEVCLETKVVIPIPLPDIGLPDLDEIPDFKDDGGDDKRVASGLRHKKHGVNNGMA